MVNKHLIFKEKEVSDMNDLIPRLRRQGWLDAPNRDFFDRFLEDFRIPSVWSEDTGFSPAFDVSETDEALIVKAELPGMEEKDIDISLSDGVLTIKGEKKQEKESESGHYHTVERRYGAFSRTMRLPAEVNAEQVDAAYKDGVLSVTMPKTEKAKPRKIEIRS
jgi:HSP20 family protein